MVWLGWTVSFHFFDCHVTDLDFSAVCFCSSDLGEKDERQHKDADLPGSAAEGRVCHPPPVGSLRHLRLPPVQSSLHPPDFTPFLKCSSPSYQILFSFPQINHIPVQRRKTCFTNIISLVCIFYTPRPLFFFFFPTLFSLRVCQVDAQNLYWSISNAHW